MMTSPRSHSAVDETQTFLVQLDTDCCNRWFERVLGYPIYEARFAHSGVAYHKYLVHTSLCRHCNDKMQIGLVV